MIKKVILQRSRSLKLRVVRVLSLILLAFLFVCIYNWIKILLPSNRIFHKELPNKTSPKYPDWSPEIDCKPKKNIVFLKTHKTGSSSVQNIFLRYGDNHNLTFILPEKYSYMGHPLRFNRRMLHSQSLTSSPYNIFTHHTRFDYTEMKFVMPNDTMFITILRQPVCSLQSLLSFIHLERLYNETSLTHAMERFFVNSSNSSTHHVLSSERLFGRFGRNQMSFDLGLDMKDFDNLEVLNKFIRQIDSQFHFVMITDRMDESLILLRHVLCWSQNDMIVFHHNLRNVNLACNLTGDMPVKIRHFNIADQMLYDYFLAKFDRQVSTFGRKRMESEMLSLHNATQFMYQTCVKKRSPMKDIVASNETWYSDLASGYEQKLNVDKICRDLTMYELAYTGYLREKQTKKV